MNYSEKLKDPRWQRKRLEIFERDSWLCQSCGRPDITLQVHHLKYLKDTEPWDYENSFLITYCEVCHETEHLIGAKINESLIDVIKSKPLFIKPVSQLCVLCENFPPFIERLRSFLNDNIIIYLQEMKNQEDGFKKGAA